MLTFEERVSCGNPLQRSDSGLDPDPEPNQDFGPGANTTQITQDAIPKSSDSPLTLIFGMRQRAFLTGF
jgi:hypothetical protein